MEPGPTGLHGVFVTRAVEVEREEDIGSVTVRPLCMEELTVPEPDRRQRTVTHTVVQVSKNKFTYISYFIVTFTGVFTVVPNTSKQPQRPCYSRQSF